MVFRRDSNKVDSFQRQMNALRQQIGDEDENDAFEIEGDRFGQQGERGRQPRQAGDEGYSFGNFPSSGLSTAQDEDYLPGNTPAIPEIPQADQQVSIIAAGTTWDGNFDAQGSLHIYGKASGTLRASEDIWIADGAEVDAQIDADRVVVGGDVTGRITAHSRFEALPNCDIQADVDAPTFVVHEGATLNGSLTMNTAAPSMDIDSREPRNRPGSIIQRRTRTSS
ncbi:MAG TPA: polymer-forming cytoskeletal protein [Thermomicrobiales bacterium]|nr:polymer-forming cytoskeletal protein [Thermomicrobiales bacterium]